MIRHADRPITVCVFTLVCRKYSHPLRTLKIGRYELHKIMHMPVYLTEENKRR